MVFYCIICSTWDILSNFSPSVSMNFVGFYKYKFLCDAPLIFFDHGVQIIEPSFSALLSVSIAVIDSHLELVSYNIPFLFTVLIDQNCNQKVLFNLPRISLLLSLLFFVALQSLLVFLVLVNFLVFFLHIL